MSTPELFIVRFQKGQLLFTDTGSPTKRFVDSADFRDGGVSSDGEGEGDGVAPDVPLMVLQPAPAVDGALADGSDVAPSESASQVAGASTSVQSSPGRLRNMADNTSVAGQSTHSTVSAPTGTGGGASATDDSASESSSVQGMAPVLGANPSAASAPPGSIPVDADPAATGGVTSPRTPASLKIFDRPKREELLQAVHAANKRERERESLTVDPRLHHRASSSSLPNPQQQQQGQAQPLPTAEHASTQQSVHSVSFAGLDEIDPLNEDKSHLREIPLEHKLAEKLQEMQVLNPTWIYESDDAAKVKGTAALVQVMFPSMGGSRTEMFLEMLAELGLGADNRSSIWVMPMTVRLPKVEPMDYELQDNVTSRLTVQQVVSQIRAQAQITLDFVLLCFSASVIAAIGLGRSDNVATVASMLISPLMSPILAVTFGTVIRDYDLIKVGLKTELFGLSICITTGLIGGMAVATWADDWGWPSDFMEDRGVPIGLLVGLAIAVPSGIGVALSVLGNNTGSLVGVAISASLLPPAVNAGMNWGYGIVGPRVNDDVDGAKQAEIGGYSLLLTVINIIVIYGMGILFLFIKEVAPPSFGQSYFFWHDVALYNKRREQGNNQGEVVDAERTVKKQDQAKVREWLDKVHSRRTQTNQSTNKHVSRSSADPQAEQLRKFSKRLRQRRGRSQNQDIAEVSEDADLYAPPVQNTVPPETAFVPPSTGLAAMFASGPVGAVHVSNAPYGPPQPYEHVIRRKFSPHYSNRTNVSEV